MTHAHPFYGKEIFADREQEKVKALLAKFKGLPVDEELKAKIWDELQMQKSLGTISIPFKVAMRRDATGKFPPCIEVILDSKL
jgi:hypothetical protein